MDGNKEETIKRGMERQSQHPHTQAKKGSKRKMKNESKKAV